MHTLQVRTLELLIIHELHNYSSVDSKLTYSFNKMLEHFSDEEYLDGIPHTAIIRKIYMDYFYQYNHVSALALKFHINNKSLLVYRKRYLHLLAKYYLGLFSPTQTDLYFFYQKLSQNRRDIDAQNHIDG